MVDAVTQEVLIDWSRNFIKYRKEAAQKLPTLTGEGKVSFDDAVLAQSQGVYNALFEFEQYLRYYDMRKLTWSNVANIDAMKYFVEKKGLQNFEAAFKEKYGYIPKDRVQFLNKVAWGIAISFKDRGTWKAKRKRWYNKGKEGSLNILYRQLLDRLSEQSLSTLKNSL